MSVYDPFNDFIPKLKNGAFEFINMHIMYDSNFDDMIRKFKKKYNLNKSQKINTSINEDMHQLYCECVNQLNQLFTDNISHLFQIYYDLILNITNPSWTTNDHDFITKEIQSIHQFLEIIAMLIIADFTQLYNLSKISKNEFNVHNVLTNISTKKMRNVITKSSLSKKQRDVAILLSIKLLMLYNHDLLVIKSNYDLSYFPDDCIRDAIYHGCHYTLKFILNNLIDRGHELQNLYIKTYDDLSINKYIYPEMLKYKLPNSYNLYILHEYLIFCIQHMTLRNELQKHYDTNILFADHGFLINYNNIAAYRHNFTDIDIINRICNAQNKYIGAYLMNINSLPTELNTLIIEYIADLKFVNFQN